ncbi:MAG: TraB/GumN family protein [Desulfobacterales bacterium CG07_land_8_20_14_0_80_52_14]|nr:MAG: TraB/GumN family protein [Desulfobacterales bacterium CG23_combo_of_CG06-09_8_20_14_all_52_9]PIU50461.1 MAG: TraB/GumN family protein [Desulfobacterales bacterium CG07_land_8_20_14_0_80_52_14]
MSEHPFSTKTEKPLSWTLILVLFFSACGFVVPPACIGQIYQWQDETGARHFSDGPTPDLPASLLGTEQNAVEPTSRHPSPKIEIPARLDAAPGAKGVLWRIERSGLRPSFLMGTIHVEDERVLQLSPAAELAFSATDALVLELVLDEVAVFKAAAAMIYMDGTDLKAVLGEDLFTKTASAMKTYGVPEIALRRMKPWAVMSTLMVPKPKTGNFLDLLLYRRAVQSGKSVFGLETVEEQVGVLESLPLKDQIEILRETLDQFELFPRVFSTMIEMYLAGDLDGLAALSERFIQTQDRGLVNRFMERLNDNRNLRMAERLQTYLEQGNVFVAVGALHLSGENSLLRLLEARGYTVIPG